MGMRALALAVAQQTRIEWSPYLADPRKPKGYGIRL
jgi:hypothetical protein